MLNLTTFIGRFHPVFVHLPIGILLIAVVFQWMAWRSKNEVYQKPLFLAVGAGAASAVLSCITGYLLSGTAEYDAEIVWWHQWLGITVAAVSLCWSYLLWRPAASRVVLFISSIVFILVAITGHLGGTLTHGEDYISFNASSDTVEQVVRKPIDSIQGALVYDQIVKPIFSATCYSCHSDKKQKGKLRLDAPELILKGGKNGGIIEPTALTESELLKRISLPLSDKKHMPPRDKKQLTNDEIALVHWWVETGAAFDKKVAETKQTDKIMPMLAALEKPRIEKQAADEMPVAAVAPASKAALDTLKKRGVAVLPLASTTNYLSANFVGTDMVDNSVIALLKPLNNQLVILKLGNTRITDSAMKIISDFDNLFRLELQNTAITDNGLAVLAGLKNLRDLNLVGTSVTSEGVLKLKSLKSLRTIYLYQTPAVNINWQKLQQALPSVRLDSGGYVVPILKTDTSVVKPLEKS